jgi:hypothetical protein
MIKAPYLVVIRQLNRRTRFESFSLIQLKQQSPLVNEVSIFTGFSTIHPLTTFESIEMFIS